MQAGYAEIDITPGPGIELTGYGYWLDRRAKGTLDPLAARAAALGEGDAIAVVVQLDLLALSSEFVAVVRSKAAERCGIRPEAVMLHCTHTHSGPAVRPLTGCGMPDPAFVARLQEQLVDLIDTAVRARTPVEAVKWFQRDFPDGFAQNRTGGDDLDTHVRGLWLDMGRSGPVCLVSYACHPVTLGRGSEYSADYCGAVLRELNAYGIRTLYLNGCCGDVNPLVHRVKWGSGSADTLRIYGRDLAGLVRAAARDAESCPSGPVRACSELVPLDVHVPETDELEAMAREHEERGAANPDDHRARVTALWARALLERQKQGTLDRVCSTEIQAIAIGDSLIVGLGAETFTRMGLILRQVLERPPRLLIAATTNGVIGYIGDRRDVENSGYASSDACRIYGMPHPRPGAGEKWIGDGAERLRSWLDGG
ncbi:MAG: hypothetical protein GXP31_16705 [Kiritimatiellaeota bacterium]|nr:hypothetical protein [Kiritimatiellota bacterium]